MIFMSEPLTIIRTDPNLAKAAIRYGVSDRAVAAIYN